MPEYYDDVEASVDRALAVLGNHIVMGAPLGLGKPNQLINCLLYTSPSPRDRQKSRMPSSA